MSRLRIASRGSELALWQSRSIASALRAAEPRLRIEIRTVRTTGDRVADVPLTQIGERGLFTKELDAALLRGDAELAVHSLKDVPTRLGAGLELVAITRRADPRDVLICRGAAGLAALPRAARVGTSSLRRRAQLLASRADLQLLDLRGNLDTRLARLDAGDYDAIVLAAAGVLRLGWGERITEYLEPPGWLPAVGQGALAVVAPAEKRELAELLRPLHDEETAACVAAERALLRVMEGGCQVPVGALATPRNGSLVLDALVATLDGTRIVRRSDSADAGHAERLGESLARELLSGGGDEILRGIREGEQRVAPIAAP